jgi:hypothetical protein
MTFSADYALSRYGGIAYGVRGSANYNAAFSDSATSADAIIAVAAFGASISDAAASSDSTQAVAVFNSLIADGVAGNDSLAASNNVAFSLSESITSSYLLVAVTDFGIHVVEQIAGLDGSIFNFFRPINIRAVEREKRNAALHIEIRAATANAREAARVHQENRQSVTETDNRNVSVKTDNRHFET